MKIWFIADTHFGEQPRGRVKASGLSAEALDALIAERWRERVAPDDQVYHLGDVGTPIGQVRDLPGRKICVLGNGDRSQKAVREAQAFEAVHKQLLLPIADGALFLVHDPRHAPADPGGAIVHGHTHAADPAPGHRSVSVDRTDWAPICLEELLARTA